MAAWGCFRLLSKPHMGERELLLFSAPAHCIGRNPERCDVVLDLQYISSVVRAWLAFWLGSLAATGADACRPTAALRGGAGGPHG